MTVLDDVPLFTPLEDICSLEQFLAPIGPHKETILKTIETIERSEDPELNKNQEVNLVS